MSRVVFSLLPLLVATACAGEVGEDADFGELEQAANVIILKSKTNGTHANADFISELAQASVSVFQTQGSAPSLTFFVNEIDPTSQICETVTIPGSPPVQ